MQTLLLNKKHSGSKKKPSGNSERHMRKRRSSSKFSITSRKSMTKDDVLRC